MVKAEVGDFDFAIEPIINPLFSFFNNFLQWCKLTFEQKKEDEEKRIAEEKRIIEEKAEQERILKETQDKLTERKIEIYDVS